MVLTSMLVRRMLFAEKLRFRRTPGKNVFREVFQMAVIA